MLTRESINLYVERWIAMSPEAMIAEDTAMRGQDNYLHIAVTGARNNRLVGHYANQIERYQVMHRRKLANQQGRLVVASSCMPPTSEQGDWIYGVGLWQTQAGEGDSNIAAATQVVSVEDTGHALTLKALQVG